VVWDRERWAGGLLWLLLRGGKARPVGERKKSSDHVFSVLPGAFLDPFSSSCRTRDCWRVRREGLCARREGSRGTMDASGRLVISRNSFIVKAASRGPRLPMIETCFTADLERTSKTGLGTSYFESSLTFVRSIRATSRETFPFPMIDT
jgi:hypothetical protein